MPIAKMTQQTAALAVYSPNLLQTCIAALQSLWVELRRLCKTTARPARRFAKHNTLLGGLLFLGALLGPLHLAVAEKGPLFPSSLPPCSKTIKSATIACVGRINHPDGSHYVGELINGVASGKGIREYLDGQSYSGDWLNGKADGQGVFRTQNGDQFTGTFSVGRASGRGEWKYKNRDNYVGEVLDGQANGKGVYTWANGNKYVGDFLSGKKHGIGTLFRFKGGRYEGQFVNDEISGRGVAYDLAGNIVERGRYVRGQLVEVDKFRPRDVRCAAASKK